MGSLWNALLNFLYARKHQGRFNVRIDGHLIKGQRILDRESILNDLRTFGLEWDELILQSDRLQEHKDAFRDLVASNPESFYECDCTINDIAQRNLFSRKDMYLLTRNEKYPRPCSLIRLELFDAHGKEIAKNQKISASSSSVDTSPDVLLTDQGDYSKFWKNIDIGHMQSPEKTALEIELDEAHSISSVQFTFRDYPFLDYQVYVWQDGWKCVARVNKPVEFFVEPRPSVPYLINYPERINFAPVLTNKVKIVITRLPLPLDRPYHYDYHCKALNKKLDWTDKKTVVRAHFRPQTIRGYLNFVTEERIPDKVVRIDTAAWFDGKPDLVFSSPYDDKKMGATHLIRGSDIYPFFFMESMLTSLLDYRPKLFFHSMVVDKSSLKYSKFVKSTPLSQYLSPVITPGKIIGYLAWKGGIVPEYPGEVELSDLLASFNLQNICKEHVIIDERDMMSFLEA